MSKKNNNSKRKKKRSTTTTTTIRPVKSPVKLHWLWAKLKFNEQFFGICAQQLYTVFCNGRLEPTNSKTAWLFTNEYNNNKKKTWKKKPNEKKNDNKNTKSFFSFSSADKLRRTKAIWKLSFFCILQKKKTVSFLYSVLPFICLLRSIYSPQL